MFLTYRLEETQRSCFGSEWVKTKCQIYPHEDLEEPNKEYFSSEYDLIGRILANVPIYIVKLIKDDQKLIYSFRTKEEVEEYFKVLGKTIGNTVNIINEGRYLGSRNVYRMLNEMKPNRLISFTDQRYNYQISYWQL